MSPDAVVAKVSSRDGRSTGLNLAAVTRVTDRTRPANRSQRRSSAGKWKIEHRHLRAAVCLHGPRDAIFAARVNWVKLMLITRSRWFGARTFAWAASHHRDRQARSTRENTRYGIADELVHRRIRCHCVGWAATLLAGSSVFPMGAAPYWKPLLCECLAR